MCYFSCVTDRFLNISSHLDLWLEIQGFFVLFLFVNFDFVSAYRTETV